MSRLTEKIALTKTQWMMLLIAIVYVVSPVDLVPELVTGPIGLTDDAAALALIATTAVGGWKVAKERRRSMPPAPQDGTVPQA